MNSLLMLIDAFAFPLCPCKSFFWDVRFISSVGILIAILTFVIERFLNNAAQKARVKETWFLSIIVTPNLESINGFYTRVIDSLRHSDELLKLHVGLPHDKYLELCSSQINEFNVIRRSFINNFISLVQAHSYSLSLKITEIINGLNDLYTNHLDNIQTNHSTISMEDIENNILRNKALMINELFKSIKE